MAETKTTKKAPEPKPAPNAAPDPTMTPEQARELGLDPVPYGGKSK